MQRGPGEREARYLRFTLQRPGNLIYIPHLLAHALSTVETGAPTILSGWDAATTSNQQVILQTLDEYTFGEIRGKWREIFRRKALSAVREWVFSPSTCAQEKKDRLQKQCSNWEQHSPNLLSSFHIEKEFPRKIKSNCVPLYNHLNSVKRIKALLVQGFYIITNYSSDLILTLHSLRVSIYITLTVNY